MSFTYTYKNNNKGFRNRNTGKKFNNTVQSTRKATTSEAVTDRDFVVICADKNGRVATFAENTNYISENYSDCYNDTKLGMFEQLRDVLETIPAHTDELLDKSVAIYVPSAICFENSNEGKRLCDLYRNDNYETCQDIMVEVADMLHDRALNCFIVDIKGSKATIVQHAYEFVEEETKKANMHSVGKEYVAKAKATETTGAVDKIAEKIAELECKIADAIIDGNDDLVAKLESAVARLKGANKPAVKEEQPADELANVEL